MATIEEGSKVPREDKSHLPMVLHHQDGPWDGNPHRYGI